MTSILSRLLTADKPWTAPYLVPAPPPVPVVVQRPTVVSQHQHNVVSGNEFPQTKRRRSPKKSLENPVRFGRVPKREKAKILAAMQKVNASSQEKALGIELEDELRLLTTIVRAHEETCDYTRDKVAGLVERARTQPVYAQCPSQLACPLNPAPHILDNGVNHYMEDFSERFAPAIKGVVEFAKRIPGFGFLSQDDQVTLLKAGVFEVLLVRLACMFDASANSLICLNGQVLRRDSLHSASNARFLLDSMFDFAERMNALRLSDSEVGLFCAVVVIAADRPGLRNTDLVLKVQKKLMDILQKSVCASHPENPNLFGDLMKKIPDLRTLNTLHSEKLLAYKMEPRNQQNNHNSYHDIWNQYTGAPTVEDTDNGQWSTTAQVILNMRSNSPGQNSTTGSEWSTTDSKDDPVGSPRSVGSSMDAKSPSRSSHLSPTRSSSFSSSRSYVHEEVWQPEHGLIIKNHPGSEHGSSSGDEMYFVDSPVKSGQPVYPRLIRRVDSPTDSGIESGKEHSVPSPVEDKQSTIEDMPVLKRALQAPPLVPPHALMDEAYRHHKKFRAASIRREAECPQQASLASTHSTLASTLAAAPRYLSEQQLKRTDLIHNMIMQKETTHKYYQQQQNYQWQLNEQPSYCSSTTRSETPPQQMLISPLVMNGQSQQQQVEESTKPASGDTRPLNLCKRPFSPPQQMLEMES